jgi:hypothetical protein
VISRPFIWACKARLPMSNVPNKPLMIEFLAG